MILETALILATGAISSSKTRVALIEKCSEALGGALKPWQIRREAKAKAEARIIDAEADQKIASLAQRAENRLLGQAMREQQNIESIVAGALPNVNENANPEKIDQDWLSNFFDKNKLVSNEQMQQLWSQILAGEANEPGTFSNRTVNLVASLNSDDALLIRKICSFIFSVDTDDSVNRDDIDNSRYIFFNISDLNKPPFGIMYSEILHLRDIGFISLDNGDYVILKKEIKIDYYGKRLIVKSNSNHDNDPGVRIGNIFLTIIGKELSLIVKPDINYNIFEYWKKYYIDHKYEVI